MAPGFSFPPPPPPPPRSSGSAHPASIERGRGRGSLSSGRDRGGGFEGRGSFNTGARSPAMNSTTPTQQYPAGSYINPHFHNTTHQSSPAQATRSTHEGSNFHNQKRKRDETIARGSGSWRGGQGQGPSRGGHPMKQQANQPKPEVVSAVPSFGSPFPFPSANAQGTAASQSSSNSLGLTPGGKTPPPYAQSDESEEDDADEEVAFQKVCGESLKFEHNGEIVKLETLADIIEWKAERKRNFATSWRIEEKRREKHARMQERQRIEQETSFALDELQRAELRHAYRKAPEQERPGYQSLQPMTSEDGQKGSGLRATPNDNAEEAGDVCVSENAGESKPQPTGTPEQARDGEDGDSGSEGSDSAPEVQPSKPTHEPPTSIIAATGRPCNFFQATGKCRYGKRCNFAHVRNLSVQSQDRKPDRKKPGQAERKTLYQRLVEQEVEAENKLALQAIKYLGNLGFLRAGVVNTEDQ
ncbi:hypothetical protein CAC42_5094 [Sphaceloma murrayae]|uniref:C3H1-type domain-containing protein n=1 Tax=Sphaceloma murrayae TaxID=2082308 RepID=A0A2K1QU23_9PEZI|nr:hypothetical protein CAC42_5094 [Sphaceloma murrayae]